MKNPLAHPSSKLTFASLITTLLVFAMSPRSSQAATDTWLGTGADSRWLTSGNWSPGTPSAGDLLIFQGTRQLNNTNNFGLDTAFSGISFSGPGGFNLFGNRISLTGNITNNQIVTLETITLPLVLSVSPFVDVTNTGSLTLGGVVSGTGVGIVKTGGGALTLGNGGNTFTNSGTMLTINAGTVRIGGDGQLGAVPASRVPTSIVINGGTLNATAGFTINSNRGIAVGPSSGTGSGIVRVDSGNTLVYRGNIGNNPGGTGKLVKNGFGNLTLSGTNSYTGATSNRIGILTLDFANAFAPVSNIISSASSLSVGGENSGVGTDNSIRLVMNTKGSGTNTQTFNGTFFDLGHSLIQVTNAGAGTAIMNLGALTHITNGGAITFMTPTSAGGSGKVTTTSANVNDILGAWATIASSTAVNGILAPTNWASVAPDGSIVAYTNFFVYSSGNLAGQVTAQSNLLIATATQVNVDAENATTTNDVNTILIGGTTPFVFNIGSNNVLRLGRFGGILMTNVGATANENYEFGNGLTTGGNTGSTAYQDAGTLTAGGAPNTPGELVFTINSGSQTGNRSIYLENKIIDNGPSGPVTVIKTGAGPMKFRGHNTFSGNMYILEGRIQMAGSELANSFTFGTAAGTANTANPDAFGSGSIFVLPGGQAFPSGSGGNTNSALSVITNNWFLAGNGVSDNVGAIRLSGIYSNGIMTLIGDTRLGGGNFILSGASLTTVVPLYDKITGAFNLDIGATGNSGGGANGARLFNTNNDWSGDTTVVGRTGGTAGNTMLHNGASDVIPDGFGKGNMQFGNSGNTASTTAWDLNGFNETVNGLVSVGTVPALMYITNAPGNAASTLAIGNNDASGTFSGSIGGNIALIKVGGGTETLTGTNTYNGATTITNGSLALGATGSISNSAVRVTTAGTLDVSANLAGANPFYSAPNPVTLDGGTLAGNTAGSSAVPAGGISTLNITNGAVTLAINPSTTNIYVGTLTSGGTSNRVNITSVQGVASYPARFTIFKYGTFTGLTNFTLGTVPSASTVGLLSNDVANSAIVLVLTDGPKPLVWTGTDATNPTYWNVSVTTNWLAFGITAAPFNTADTVTFNDVGTSTTVDIRETVNPAAITNSGTKSYNFIGVGAISGSGGLNKQGSGTISFYNTGVDSYKGGVIVAGGAAVFASDNAIGGGLSLSNGTVVQMGTNGPSGTLPSGGIANAGGVVLFDNTTNITYSGIISGNGNMTNISSGRITLSGANTFTGTVAAATGIVRAGNAGAFGTRGNNVVIASGATLDDNSQDLRTANIIAQGVGTTNGGAIVNFGSDQNPAFTNITLIGDTTFGGTGRWDLRSASAGSPVASLAGNVNLVKVGPNDIRFADVTIDPFVGLKDIDVKEGTLTFEGSTTSGGVAANTLTVESGATLQLINLSSQFDKNIVLNGDGATTTITGGGPGPGNVNFINSANGITLNGNVIINAASQSYLKLKAGFGISGTANVVKTGSGTNILDGTIGYTGSTTVSNGIMLITGTKTFGTGTGITVVQGASLGGNGTLNENITSSGTLVPGDPLNDTATPLVVNGNVSLTNGTNTFVLRPSGTGNSAMLDGINNLTVSGIATIQIRAVPGAPLTAGQTNTLFHVTGTSVGTNSFTLAPLQGYTFELLTNADGKSIDLHVITAVGDLQWDGKAGNGGVWNTLGVQSWHRNQSLSDTNFAPGDFVTFDDNASLTTVNITGDVGPAPNELITFLNANFPYTLIGSGSITGSTGIKIGDPTSTPSTVTIANSNRFSGPVVLLNGVLSLTNNGSIGTAGILSTNTGSLAYPAGLTFQHSDSNLVISGNIVGGVVLTNLGAGAVTLSGNNTNSLTNGVFLLGGTLRLANASAMANVNSEFIGISNNASLDIATNNLNIARASIEVGGAGVGGTGAILNSSGSSTFVGQNFARVTMDSDTTIGGSGRLDFRSTVAADNTNAFLSTGSNPYNLTKVGTNQLQLGGVLIDSALANIDVQGGTFGIQWIMPSLGNPANTLTVHGGATFNLFDMSNSVNKVLVLQDGATFGASSGDDVFVGPSITMQGSNTFNVAGATTTLAISNGAAGSGAVFSKAGSGDLIIHGTLGWTGDTRITGGGNLILDGNSVPASPVFDVRNGGLDLTHATSTTLTLGSQTLSGSGDVFGSVVANSGAVIAPGISGTTNSSIGTLTVHTNVTLNTGSTTVFELDAGLATNDVLVVSNNLQYGGTVTWTTNGNGVLTNGQIFRLFAVGGTIGGTFSATNFPNIAPFSWVNILSNGTVSVAAPVGPGSPTNSAGILSSRLIGTNLVVHGTNNNIPNTAFHYAVMTSTNILTPLSNWTSVVTNSFDAGGTFDYTNPVTPGSSSRLFIDVRAVP